MSNEEVVAMKAMLTDRTRRSNSRAGSDSLDGSASIAPVTCFNGVDTSRTPGRPAMSDATPLVLVVDDYQDAREMYAEYLSFSGFRVAEASNGLEAIEKAFTLQ